MQLYSLHYLPSEVGVAEAEGVGVTDGAGEGAADDDVRSGADRFFLFLFFFFSTSFTSYRKSSCRSKSRRPLTPSHGPSRDICPTPSYTTKSHYAAKVSDGHDMDMARYGAREEERS